jgi:F-type H+-transporting ATPase subunit b
MPLPLLPALLQQEHAASGPLAVEPGLMIWTVIVFVALLFILRKFAWPSILGAVEARERALEAQLAEAERNRREAAELLAQHQKLLAEGRAQAQTLLAEARSSAERERALSMEKARHEQEELLERARRDIGAERDRAVVELRREAVDLSLAAATKLIGERLNSENDRRIVQEYLSGLGTEH